MSQLNPQPILLELRNALQMLYGERLSGLYLYGSYARNEASESSDIDVLIVLKGQVRPAAEIWNMNDLVSALCLKYNVLISLNPVSEERFLKRDEPLLRNIQHEWVLL